MEGRLYQINISRGGVPKLPTDATELTVDGLDGDKQNNLKYHGGPDRAVCLYSLEKIIELQNEGNPIRPGSVGENLTISGIEWSLIAQGDRLLLGDLAMIEITKYAVPCKSIIGSFANGDSNRISQKLYPGWSRLYAKVLVPGTLAAGQSVHLIKAN